MSSNIKQLNLLESYQGSENNFFYRKRSWSAAKHRIILRYIQAYCYTLGGSKVYQSNRINYIDGFAGTGVYDEGIGIEDFTNQSKFWKRYQINFDDKDGSPIIALKLARAFKEENRVNLSCFFSEAKKSNHEKLTKNCLSIGDGLDYKIYECQTFRKVFPTLMEDLGSYPAIFFIDTFGVKGFEFEQIKDIGKYLSENKGELFLLFHNRQIARHAGHLTTTSNDPKSLKASETYMKNLTNFLGPSSEHDWQEKWMQLKDKPQSFEKWALAYFCQRIVSETQVNGIASYEIKEKYDDVRPQYSIVVCSNHPRKAFGDYLNDFFADENRLLFFRENSILNLTDFLDSEWNKQTVRQKMEVKSKIKGFINGNIFQWRELKDVVTSVILEFGKQEYGLGYLKRSEYKELIDELFQEGEIEGKELGRNNNIKYNSLIRMTQEYNLPKANF
ncbi:MAG: three-Cys-motif partner protein TcmP [Cyanobacteria bacterium P01_D01_bin.44]